MSMRDGKQRKFIGGLLLVGVVLLGVLAGLYASSALVDVEDRPPDHAASRMPDGRTDRAQDAEPPKPTRDSLPREVADDAPPAVREPVVNPGTPELPDSEKRFPKKGQPGETTVLNFQYVTGEPATDVKVLVRHGRNGGQDVTMPRQETLTTDSAGQLTVNAIFPDDFDFKLKSDDLLVIAHQSRMKPDVGWRTQFGASPIVIMRVRQVDVSVYYADGLAYNGEASMSAMTMKDDRSGHPDWTNFSFEVVRGHAVIDVPVNCQFNVGAESRRPGFASGDVRSTTVEPLADRIELVLAAKEVEKGTIDIDLLEFSSDVTVRILINTHLVSHDVPHVVKINGGRIYSTRGLAPGQYRVYVSETSKKDILPRSFKAWHSDVITLKAGKTVRVKAKSQLCASVTAKLVDEKGLPLKPARLFIELDRKAATNWAEIRREFSDDGVATISNAYAGHAVIGAEAPGYDIVFTEIELIPGQHHDLGVIELPPASGVIEVEVTNWDSNKTYSVELRKWTGSSLTERIEMKNGKHRFDGISTRWYSVVVYGTGLDFHYENVRLSPEKPTAKLEFEMHPRKSR